ncbi:hypothetical protein ACOMHN_040044 [Nucella lapillus]
MTNETTTTTTLSIIQSSILHEIYHTGRGGKKLPLKQFVVRLGLAMNDRYQAGVAAAAADQAAANPPVPAVAPPPPVPAVAPPPPVPAVAPPPPAERNASCGCQVLRKLEKENEDLNSDLACKICMDERSTVVFLPCGHMVACTDCAVVLKTCPLCRADIRGTVKAQMEC